jgi:hypothetical protein
MRLAGAGNAGALKRLKDVLVSQPFPLLSARRYPHHELLGFDVRVCTDDQALCSNVFPNGCRRRSQLVGSWVNTMMYMLVIVQVSLRERSLSTKSRRSFLAQAFSVWSDQGRRRHKLQTKTLISTVLIVDTVGTCASCAQVYFVGVLHSHPQSRP